MAIVAFTGFECGNTADLLSAAGTYSIQSTEKRTGNYALRVNPTTTATGSIRLRGLGNDGGLTGNFNAATIYARFYFKYLTLPASGDEPIFRTADGTVPLTKLELRINSEGKLAAYDSAGTLLATGATALGSGWHRIEVKGGTGAGTAVWEVKLNGAVEISGTNADLLAANNAQIELGKFVNRNGKSVDFYFDDVAVDTVDYPGQGKCVRMDPDGAGNYTAWTGSVTDVDEVPHDGDTTYITDSTNGHASTFAMESGASAGASGTVNAVRTCAIVRDEGGTSSLKSRLRSGSTDLDQVSAIDPGATYNLRGRLSVTDPATGAAWLLAALDSIEVGVVNLADVAVRCTSVYAMVDCAGADADVYPPLAPDTLAVGTITASSIALSWNDNAANEDGYTLQYDTNEDFSAATEIDIPAGDTETATVLSLTGDTLYYFRVRAYNSAGTSVWSNTASGTTVNDLSAPTASITTAPTIARGDATAGIVVTIEDDVNIESDTITTDAFTVTAPDGQVCTITNVSADPAGDATSIAVTLTIALPGGAAGSESDGTWTVASTSNAANQVADTSGNKLTGTIGTFTAEIRPAVHVAVIAAAVIRARPRGAR